MLFIASCAGFLQVHFQLSDALHVLFFCLDARLKLLVVQRVNQYLGQSTDLRIEFALRTREGYAEIPIAVLVSWW